jgi:hypothetical protein
MITVCYSRDRMGCSIIPKNCNICKGEMIVINQDVTKRRKEL